MKNCVEHPASYDLMGLTDTELKMIVSGLSELILWTENHPHPYYTVEGIKSLQNAIRCVKAA